MVVPGIAFLREEGIALFKHRVPASEELFSILALRAFLVADLTLAGVPPLPTPLTPNWKKRPHNDSMKSTK